jgi:hypothetical protein
MSRRHSAQLGYRLTLADVSTLVGIDESRKAISGHYVSNINLVQAGSEYLGSWMSKAYVIPAIRPPTTAISDIPLKFGSGGSGMSM